ncbi:MAG: restriction endonuclease-like protein [Bacteroidales bacterium]|nr:restriction endonuclease-like protein [Bacteroidales bacterium]
MEVLRYTSDDGLVEIKIATTSIVDSWRRFSSRVGEQAHTYCNYSSSRPGRLALSDSKGGGIAELNAEDAVEWLGLWPVMYETCIYTFSLQFRNVEGTPQIVHPSKEVTDRFNVFAGGNLTFLNGSVDFMNEPGKFSLRYRYKPKGQAERTDSLDFLVVSPKLDIKTDGRHILDEVNREYNDLVFKYLTKTFQGFKPEGPTDNPLIWLSIFKSIVKDYLQAVAYIVNKPHFREQRNVYHHRLEQIKHWSPQLVERFAEAYTSGTLDHTRFRNEVAEATIDTRENRFVKYTLQSIGQRLKKVVGDLQRNFGEELSDEEHNELRGYERDIDALTRNRLFRNVSRFDGFRQESIVLQKRTGYAQVYRAWHILNSGLSLVEGTTDIGVRPIWELYELWCFLKMKQLIENVLGIDRNTEEGRACISEYRPGGFDPFLVKEMEHIVTYQKTADGDRVELRYQHTYNRRTGEMHTATTEQRPDIVLNIVKPDGFTLTYLYDAKYRVLDDANAADRDDEDTEYADYPPSDAINQMHRYRDAIYYGSGRENHAAKEIIGGYILFPGRTTDAKVRERYYVKSIATVNIGAFPLLPSADDPESEGQLLREHIEQVLLEKTKYEQIKNAVPQKGLEYVAEEMPKPTDMILVGYYKPEIWPIIEQTKLYYIPIGLDGPAVGLTSGFERTKYILLHSENDRNIFAVDWSKPPRIATREQLAAQGFTPSRGEVYLVFTLRYIIPISISQFDPYRIRIPSRLPFFKPLGELKVN